MSCHVRLPLPASQSSHWPGTTTSLPFFVLGSSCQAPVPHLLQVRRGDDVTAEREGLLRIHGGQHGLSAVPCDTEWWRREREREREASLARGLTRVAASCPSFGGKATTTTKPSVPAAGRIPGHASATAAPVPPLPSSCSASPLPPISLPPGAKRTQEGSRALARRTGSRKKEGGGVCPRLQETERERAQRSQPFITTITHHHQPSPANDTCSCWPPRPSWPLYFHDLRRSSERARLLPMGARAHIPSRRRRAERRLR